MRRALFCIAPCCVSATFVAMPRVSPCVAPWSVSVRVARRVARRLPCILPGMLPRRAFCHARRYALWRAFCLPCAMPRCCLPCFCKVCRRMLFHVFAARSPCVLFSEHALATRCFGRACWRARCRLIAMHRFNDFPTRVATNLPCSFAWRGTVLRVTRYSCAAVVTLQLSSGCRRLSARWRPPATSTSLTAVAAADVGPAAPPPILALTPPLPPVPWPPAAWFIAGVPAPLPNQMARLRAFALMLLAAMPPPPPPPGPSSRRWRCRRCRCRGRCS